MNAPLDPERWKRARRAVEEALAVPAAERARILRDSCGGDGAVRAEAQRLLDLDAESSSALEPPTGEHAFLPMTGSEAPPVQRIGPWELRRCLGVGGMGSVWLGVQVEGDFHRRVAVKLLHRDREGSELRARFERERQVLANLEHPGIARLIDGNVSPEGIPYIVMEYVEGVRIDRWCEEQRLSIAQRLELFGSVCEAVHHAHQRLVVHRDLKPSNILVTVEGRAKLLDFGIAKVLDPEKEAAGAEVTRGVARFFTPSYASPEQVLGQPVTTASDVYSLGVLLYQLLTDQLPYRFETTSAAEVSRVLTEVEPDRPSAVVRRTVEVRGPRGETTRITPEVVGRRRLMQPAQVRRALAGDLDRIVLKALRKEAWRRYASAHELAEDLRRHVAGLPVSARTDSFAYRLSKLAGRNRLAAGLLVLLSLSLVGGSVAGWRLYWIADEARALEREQRATAEARLESVERLRAELEARNVELSAARDLAAGQRDDAHALAADLERARALADRRFDDVRRFATTLLFDVHRNIHGLEGAGPATELLLRTGLEFLDQLAAESGDDADLAREVGWAYLRLSDALASMSSGVASALEQAADAARKAEELAERLHARDPASPDDLALLVQSKRFRGDVERARGDHPAAVELYREGVSLAEPLEGAARPKVRDLYGLGEILLRLALTTGHSDGAVADAAARARASFERVLDLQPGAQFVRRDLAEVAGIQAGLAHEAGDLERARELADEAVEHAEAAVATDTSPALQVRTLGLALVQRGHIEAESGSAERARPILERALAHLAGLSRADPGNRAALGAWRAAATALGRLLADAEAWDEARDVVLPVIEFAERDGDGEPAHHLHRLDLAILHGLAGRVESRAGNGLAAGQHLARAQDLLEELGHDMPQLVEVARQQAECYALLGAAYERSADPGRAAAWRARAMEVLEDLVARGVARPSDRRRLEQLRAQ